MARIEREKETRKQEMMKAAEKLFVEKGFENVNMEEIARESEFTRKTLYSYFKDKDDLYRQVFLYISIQRWNFLARQMSLSEDGIPRIRAYGQANYEYTIANPEHFKLIVHIDQKGVQPQAHNAEFQKEINLARKEIHQLLVDAYESGRNNGSIRSDFDLQRNITQLSISLRAMLNEIVLDYEEKEFYFDFLELFIQAIKV